MNKHNKNTELETIISLGTIAFITSVGILFFVLLFLGIDIRTLGPAFSFTICSIVSAILWIALLNRNC